MSLLPVAEARARILDGVDIGESEIIDLTAASNRILAEDLTARRSQPPFDASSMDGYAVRSEDIANCPVTLKLIGEAPAGRMFEGTVGKGEAVRIFTGAPVPKGADAVVMQENTNAGDGVVEILESVGSGNFIRPTGLDFKDGNVVLKAGQKLNARNIGLAASMNHADIWVRRKPVVAILSNGDELVPPGGNPRPDQIIASNSISLAAAVRAFGGEPLDLGIAPDRMDIIKSSIKKGLEADILVTIGGASVGDHDLIGPAFGELGIELGFWKIAMRPGKPVIFATKGKTRILGLPGNPVSSLVCSRIYLKPLIEKMLGASEVSEIFEASLTKDLPANDLRQDYLRAVAEPGPDGMSVTPFPKQDSSMQRTLAHANALIVRKPFAEAVKAGDKVSVLPLDF